MRHGAVEVESAGEESDASEEALPKRRRAPKAEQGEAQPGRIQANALTLEQRRKSTYEIVKQAYSE